MQAYQEQIGTQPTSSLKTAIVDLTKAMKADFGRLYSSAFKDPEDLREFKNRLLSRLKGIDASSLVDGYERLLEQNIKYPPTAQEILKSTIHVETERKRKIREQQKLLENENSSPPTHECNPVEMLSETKKEEPTEKLTKEEKIELQRKRVAEHEALIKLHIGRGMIKSARGRGSLCASFDCVNPGSISSSLHGSETWYCIDHFRKSA